MAEASLEDFRIKLQLDRAFPPNAPEDCLYSYRDLLVAGGKVRGNFSMTIDTTYALPPYSILVVALTGEAAPQPKQHGAINLNFRRLRVKTSYLGRRKS